MGTPDTAASREPSTSGEQDPHVKRGLVPSRTVDTDWSVAYVRDPTPPQHTPVVPTPPSVPAEKTEQLNRATRDTYISSRLQQARKPSSITTLLATCDGESSNTRNKTNSCGICIYIYYINLVRQAAKPHPPLRHTGDGRARMHKETKH